MPRQMIYCIDLLPTDILDEVYSTKIFPKKWVYERVIKQVVNPAAPKIKPKLRGAYAAHKLKEQLNRSFVDSYESWILTQVDKLFKEYEKQLIESDWKISTMLNIYQQFDKKLAFLQELEDSTYEQEYRMYSKINVRTRFHIRLDDFIMTVQSEKFINARHKSYWLINILYKEYVAACRTFKTRGFYNKTQFYNRLSYDADWKFV